MPPYLIARCQPSEFVGNSSKPTAGGACHLLSILLVSRRLSKGGLTLSDGMAGTTGLEPAASAVTEFKRFGSY